MNDSLARYFRLSLSKSRTAVQIRDELELVRVYFVLQQTSYKALLRMNRSIQVEGAFGVLKSDRKFKALDDVTFAPPCSFANFTAEFSSKNRYTHLFNGKRSRRKTLFCNSPFSRIAARRSE